MNNIEVDKQYSLISLPRSGQHLSERLIQKIYEYFSKDFRYCEFYTCCGNVPCKKGCNFMKNHDFKLDLTVPSHYKKIILYRTSMIEQLESFYRLVQITRRDLLKSKLNINTQVDFDYINNKKSYLDLLDFIKKKETYYNGFIAKWVNVNININEVEPNTLLLPYSDIINSPVDYVERIITFLDIPHTTEDIDAILTNFEKIEYKNSLDPVLIERIKKDLFNVKKVEQIQRPSVRKPSVTKPIVTKPGVTKHDVRPGVRRPTFHMPKITVSKKHQLGVIRFS